MKKLLLSIALVGVTALGTLAQELQFVYNGKVLENGAIISYNDYQTLIGSVNEDGYTSYAMIMVEPPVEIEYVGGDLTAEVNIQATSQTGQVIDICTGGTCISGLNPIKNEVSFEKNKPLELQCGYTQLTFTNEQVIIPYTKILVEAWLSYDEDKEDVYAVTLILGDNSDSGVEGIVNDLNTVTVDGKTLSYDLTGVNTINVYGLSGKTLLSREVAGRGSISLASLPKGIYVYKVAGKNGKSGKFVIR